MEGSTINMTSTYFGLDETVCKAPLLCIEPYHVDKFDIVSSCPDFQIINTSERDTGFYWFEKTKMISELKLKTNSKYIITYIPVKNVSERLEVLINNFLDI